MAAAVKKAGRVAAEGACYAFVTEDGVAAALEINSETDFSAMSEAFQSFLKDVTAVVAKENPTDIEDLKTKPYADSGRTVGDMLQEKVLTIGENLQIRRFARLGTPLNAAYVHMNGKIAVIVHLDVSDNLKGNPAVVELGRDVAMQIAAMKPLWLNRACVDPAALEEEKNVFTAQLKEDPKHHGKPQQVLDKIVEGRVGKYYSEVCLMEQAFVKEAKMNVMQYVEQQAKALGGQIAVTEYARFEKGEGIAKREDDFAAEVAKMTK
jgi:elongation factor Ts